MRKWFRKGVWVMEIVQKKKKKSMCVVSWCNGKRDRVGRTTSSSWKWKKLRRFCDAWIIAPRAHRYIRLLLLRQDALPVFYRRSLVIMRKKVCCATHRCYCLALSYFVCLTEVDASHFRISLHNHRFAICHVVTVEKRELYIVYLN